MDVARCNSWHQQRALQAATSPPFFCLGGKCRLEPAVLAQNLALAGRLSLRSPLKLKLNSGEKFFATVGGDRLSRAEFDRMAGCLNHWMDVSKWRTGCNRCNADLFSLVVFSKYAYNM